MLVKRGIWAVLACIALFVALHLGLAPEHHDDRTLATTALGGIAFLLMTSSIVLSTRLAALEDLFGGLDRMYQVHRVAGVLCALFALVHFFAVPKELPAGVDPAANSLTPSGPLGMLGLIILVIGLFVALNRKIRYSVWRPTHKVMGLVYVLIIGHFTTAPGVFFERFSASGIVLMAAASAGVLAFLYSVFGANRRAALPFTIEAVNALDFRAGQFAFIEVQGKGWTEPHPFTISSAPGEGRLRFTIKVLGDWTRKVREELQPGGEVLVRGPYGRFDATKAGRKQIWLAGGIGLTPFLSSLRAMEIHDDRQIHLVYAAREVRDAIYLDELRARAAELGNVTLVPLFSDEGNFARVDMMREKLPDPLDSYEYFLCGPKPMVDGLMADLKKAGVPRSRLHTEAFEFR